MKSLQARLLLATMTGAALVLAGFGLALYVAIAAMVGQAFDQALADQARALAATTDQDEAEANLEFVERRLPEFERQDRPECYQVWIRGAVAARSRALAGHDLPEFAGPLAAPAFRTAALPDGRPGRLVGVRFVPRREQNGEPAATRPARLQEVTLVVGRDTLDVAQALARLRWLLGGAGLGAIGVSALTLRWLVPRGLRPLKHLAADLQAIGGHNLSARLHPPDAPAELQPVLARLNDLLARLERSFARERAFSADVAHELRTPLSGLRAALEVSLSRPRAAADYRQTLVAGLSITSRMGTLVENLLTLARAEAGQLPVAAAPVALADLLRDAWQPFAAAAAARGLTVQWQTESAGPLLTDPDKLRLILANLFDNAVTYADPGGWVRVEAAVVDGASCLCVRNSGSRVDAADAPRTLDRFWRGDQARSATGEHFGLGLSLCRRMAELLGGSIAVHSELNGVFAVQLDLPLQPQLLTSAWRTPRRVSASAESAAERLARLGSSGPPGPWAVPGPRVRDFPRGPRAGILMVGPPYVLPGARRTNVVRHSLLVLVCALAMGASGARLCAQVTPAAAATRPATTRPAIAPAAKDNTFAARVSARITAALDQLESDGDYRKAAVTVCVLFDGVATRGNEKDIALFREAALARRLVLTLYRAEAVRDVETLKYLRKNKDLSAALLFAMGPSDRAADVLRVLAALREKHAADLESFANLAAAVCVVHDQQLSRQVNENLAVAPDAAAIFDYFVRYDKRMLFNLHALPPELLVWVVDTTAGVDEMTWALQHYAGDGRIGLRFFEIKYDQRSVRFDEEKKVTKAGFTLPNIKQYGGVCADQAYFATHVGKALGVPTATAVAQSGQVGHAWIGFLAARGNQAAWNFDAGRYEEYKGLRGNVLDPQTRRYIPDAMVSLTAELLGVKAADRYAAAAFTDAAWRLQAGDKSEKAGAAGGAAAAGGSGGSGGSASPAHPGVAGGAASAGGLLVDDALLTEVLGAAPATLSGALKEPRSSTVAAELGLLEAGLRQSPGHLPAWLVLRDLAESGKLSLADKQRWAGVLDRLCGARYPDFSYALLAPMIETVDDPAAQSAMWDGLFRLFRTREDLAAAVRMSQGKLWEDHKEYARASARYEDVIHKFANAGPFVLDALMKEEGLLQQVNQPRRVVTFWEQAWSKMERPKTMAADFMKQSNWYKVGLAYAQRLELAGDSRKASAVRAQIQSRLGKD